MGKASRENGKGPSLPCQCIPDFRRGFDLLLRNNAQLSRVPVFNGYVSADGRGKNKSRYTSPSVEADIKEHINRAAFNGLENTAYYQGKMDIWYMFACQSLDALKINQQRIARMTDFV